jgi:hypothetical protein
MAVYKVPQDVEAEDKLLGPLSFRQFIYLGIAAGSAVVGFFLVRVSIILIVIPLPIFVLFGILALPLRKDQPMEIYLVAIVRFYLKPKQRIWSPDGTMTHVVISAPLVEAVQAVVSRETTQQRLDYLARVMDSRGWAVRGVAKANDNLIPTVANEAANTSDIMDQHTDLAKSFDDLIAKKKQETIQNAKAGMQQASQTPQPLPTPQPQSRVPIQTQPWAINPYADVITNQFIADPSTSPHFNPYPTDIRQKIIQPVGSRPPARQALTAADRAATKLPAPTMKAPASPGIIRLANNPDLSISAIAHEAQRLQKRDEEVVIKLH